MSRFTGAQGPGAQTRARSRRRAQAEQRNEVTPVTRRREFRRRLELLDGDSAQAVSS